jgi:hypothetical protein
MCATGLAKFNVTHALTAHFCQRDFNATLLTNHTTVLQAFVFTAQDIRNLLPGQRCGRKTGHRALA